MISFFNLFQIVNRTMVIRPKHYIIGIIGLILAIFIFYVNSSLGNPAKRCWYLSIFTFLLWWGCWLIVFEVRDYWSFRWYGDFVDTLDLEITPLEIPIRWEEKHSEDKNLYGQWLHGDLNRSKPVLIFVHGFSDDCVYIRHYLVPIANIGYDVIAYDNRGSGRSKKVGKTR